MRLKFQENFTFGRRTSKFAKEKPQNCPPPPEKKGKKKKNPKHLKCSLTRAKGREAIKELTPPLSFFLSLSLCVSLFLSLSPVCPPLDNHEIYHKISLNF